MNTTHVTDHFTCDNHHHETSTCRRQCYIISGADAGFLKGGYRSPRKRGGGSSLKNTYFQKNSRPHSNEYSNGGSLTTTPVWKDTCSVWQVNFIAFYIPNYSYRV